jgi:hypothetical protein
MEQRHLKRAVMPSKGKSIRTITPWTRELEDHFSNLIKRGPAADSVRA